MHSVANYGRKVISLGLSNHRQYIIHVLLSYSGRTTKQNRTLLTPLLGLRRECYLQKSRFTLKSSRWKFASTLFAIRALNLALCWIDHAKRWIVHFSPEIHSCLIRLMPRIILPLDSRALVQRCGQMCDLFFCDPFLDEAHPPSISRHDKILLNIGLKMKYGQFPKDFLGKQLWSSLDSI